jgi:hypothetical protein
MKTEMERVFIYAFGASSASTTQSMITKDTKAYGCFVGIPLAAAFALTDLSQHTQADYSSSNAITPANDSRQGVIRADEVATARATRNVIFKRAQECLQYGQSLQMSFELRLDPAKNCSQNMMEIGAASQRRQRIGPYPETMA